MSKQNQNIMPKLDTTTLIKKHELCVEILEEIIFYEDLKQNIKERLEGYARYFPELREKYLEKTDAINRLIRKLEKKYDNVFYSMKPDEEHAPYLCLCDVEGCEDSVVSGGACWRETGYWAVCSKHAHEYLKCKPQPQMKQSAIDKEKRRGADGILIS